MSDLAMWRLRHQERERSGYVIHIHGSEHFLHEDEVGELMDMITAVFVHNTEKALGANYIEMQEAALEQAKPKPNLLEKLGLKRAIAPLKRRPL